MLHAAARPGLAVLGWLLLLAPGVSPPLATEADAQVCGPSPSGGVAVAPAGQERWQVTVTAGPRADRRLRALGFGRADNAVLDVPGDPVATPGDVAVWLPPDTRQTTFLLRRLTQRGPATVPLTVVADCGTWVTVVSSDAAAGGGAVPSGGGPLTQPRVAAPAAAPIAPARQADAAVPSFSHVFTLVMENHEYDAIIGNPAAPYLNSLAARYGLATQYYGVMHPSLPNYLALVGGSTFGVTANCTDCFVNQPNLADQVEASGRTWKAYLEDMPAPCALANAYPYVQSHNPFAYFDSIRTNAARCAAHVVPFSQFDMDLASGALPHYVWITPNLCHDMHDCDVQTGDAWLAQIVPGILGSAAFQSNGVLFITWDEGSTTAGCCNGANGGRIVTLVASPLSRPGFQSTVPQTHYHLLRTIEDAWGLKPLGAAASSAPMTEYFVAAPSATATATPTLTPTPSATVPPGPCAPRPPVGVVAVPNGDGRLRVTLTATTTTGQPPNLLQSVQFGRLDNAVLEIGGQVEVGAAYVVTPPAPSLTVYVRRASPGAASTVAATVRDACGDWPTVFGGGPNAF